MSDVFWDAQIAQDGEWLSLYSAPFESQQDAVDVVDCVIDQAKQKGQSIITRIVIVEGGAQ